MIEEHNTQGFAGFIKAAIIMVFTYAIDAFVKNPIGTFVSIVGLLYMFDKWRTQRNIRKQSEIDLENKRKNQK